MRTSPFKLFLTTVSVSALALPGAAGDAASVYAKTKAAVVTVRTDTGSGTGFVVGDGTLVLTCYHVIDDASWVRLEPSNGAQVSVVGVDVSRDVALLRLSRPMKRRLELRTSPPAPGSKVYAIGTPLGFLESTITEGIVGGRRTSGNVAYVQISAPVSHGSSGGPVLDDQGRVVGMVGFGIERGQGLNFAVASAELSRAMAGIRADATAANQSRKSARLAAARRAKEAATRAEAKVEYAPSTEDETGKVVVGRLGRAKKAARLYAAPSVKAEVLSRITVGLTLVVSKKTGEWLTVVMNDHRLAYIPADAVEVLPYEYVEDRSKAVATGSESKGEGPTDPEKEEARKAEEAIVAFAKRAKGASYLAGGTSLESGVGSGEFVMLAYASEGYDLSPDPAEQAKRGVPITNYAHLRPGDRVYLWDAKAKKIGEAAIYIGGGYVIMADRTQGKVATVYLGASLQKRTVAARRSAPRKPALPPPKDDPAGP